MKHATALDYSQPHWHKRSIINWKMSTIIWLFISYHLVKLWLIQCQNIWISSALIWTIDNCLGSWMYLAIQTALATINLIPLLTACRKSNKVQMSSWHPKSSACWKWLIYQLPVWSLQIKSKSVTELCITYSENNNYVRNILFYIKFYLPYSHRSTAAISKWLGSVQDW